MVEMFQTLDEVGRSSPNSFGSILASHPSPNERASNTRREIDERLRGSDRRGLSNSDDFQRLKSGVPSSAPTRNRVRPRN
jgi:predicted Zn-dependent protease